MDICKNISKPLILEIDEAEKETVAAVNQIMKRHKLPFAFYEPIIASIHRQIADGKKAEIRNAGTKYKAECEAAEAVARASEGMPRVVAESPGVNGNDSETEE